MAHSTSASGSGRRPPRLLGVFAHPDDETLCAGGTFAKYASAGADVRVISFTKGGAGQIRDAGVATRATLTVVRARELDAAGKELGLTESRCLDYPDGGLAQIDQPSLVRVASELLSEFDPDVVITFGPDGFSGHPDHVAVGAAVTTACFEMRSSTSIRLFHCHLPPNRMLLRDRLADWVVELSDRFKGTRDFARAISVFAREATALGYAADFVTLEWFPSGSYLIEQGEARDDDVLPVVRSCRDPARGRRRSCATWSAGQARGSSSESKASPPGVPATPMWFPSMTSPP